MSYNKNMKQKIFIALSILTIFSISFLIYVQRQNKNYAEDFIPTKYININELDVGTNRKDVEKLIGNEITSTASGDLLISDYKSKNIYRPHKIYYEEDSVVLIKEEITDSSINTEDMRKKYGIATNILFEKLEHSSFNLFVYIDKGIAYKGHKNGGLVLEIWYFKPTDINTFVSKYAQNYQKEPYKVQTGF